MTRAASFVAGAAIAAIEAAAAEIGTPAARAMAAEAGSLVFDPARLAAAMAEAISEVGMPGELEVLARSSLDLPAVPGTTANRRIQKANQAALVDLVRSTATARLIAREGSAAYVSRRDAETAQDTAGELLDIMVEDCSDDVFRAAASLRSALAQHVREITAGLPEIISASPSAVLPSLVISYDVHGNLDQEGEIAGRNRLARPGFVPARPIEVLA